MALPDASLAYVAGRCSFAALLPLVMMLLVVLQASPGQAAEMSMVESTTGASLAFARYIANLDETSLWRLETVEIEASLPRLEKEGTLRAIRRLSPFGQPEYQVLEIAGDQTVRQQVIVRYLAADVRAEAIPRSSIAITPVNYRFRYKGIVKTGENLVYAFLVTPRQKREGLIKGELWIDGDTGAVVRQSGCLVKRPSIFVKRVDVTRETDLHEGIAAVRVTHLSVDIRLVGRAELTIRERPYIKFNDAIAPSVEER